MAADLKTSAYLVDGADLAAADCYLSHEGAGLWEGQSEEIGVATSAGMDGGTIAGGIFKPFTHSMLYVVEAADALSVWAGIRALRRRCKPGRTVTLTRRSPDPEGADGNVDLTTTGRRQGAPRVTWLGKNTKAQVDLDWLITGGPWIGDAVTVADASGTHAIKGDLRTRKIIATLSAGAVDPVVTNTTPGNGYSFRYIGIIPAGGVEVDVMTRRATGLTGAVDLSLNLRWSKAAPFQLDPGDNVITVSSGTCALSYYPAYE